ncbi:methyl-accepting chemotaxis protein, partial [Pseudomonas aeruginosa]|uniref:methyl-accepting chemotaxis protein n=1 Tax=Pseudomonas aeruginosa TaxID=287 RepID=UPI003CC53C6A
FAVLADEVRSLAQRTAASTELIHHHIAKLQNTANHAVHTMESGLHQAEAGVQPEQEAHSAQVGISEPHTNITEMSTQFAAPPQVHT